MSITIDQALSGLIPGCEPLLVEPGAGLEAGDELDELERAAGEAVSGRARWEVREGQVACVAEGEGLGVELVVDGPRVVELRLRPADRASALALLRALRRRG